MLKRNKAYVQLKPTKQSLVVKINKHLRSLSSIQWLGLSIDNENTKYYVVCLSGPCVAAGTAWPDGTFKRVFSILFVYKN